MCIRDRDSLVLLAPGAENPVTPLSNLAVVSIEQMLRDVQTNDRLHYACRDRRTDEAMVGQKIGVSDESWPAVHEHVHEINQSINQSLFVTSNFIKNKKHLKNVGPFATVSRRTP